jgi:hypothetical protein
MLIFFWLPMLFGASITDSLDEISNSHGSWIYVGLLHCCRRRDPRGAHYGRDEDGYPVMNRLKCSFVSEFMIDSTYDRQYYLV